MKMREVSFDGQYPVDGYGPGGFRIADVWHEGSVVVSLEGVSPIETPLTLGGLGPVLALADRVDVVLVGQGEDIAPLPVKLRVAFEEAGIGVEIMSTPSACRTYNVLLSEARRVAAVLTAL